MISCLLSRVCASCMAWVSASSLTSPLLSVPHFLSPVLLRFPFLSLLSLLAPPLNELNQHGFPSSSLLSPPSFHLWFPLCACIFSALTSNMSVRLHPSPHLLITQQIHGNMYLWLSWGTYVIICKTQTDFWSATSRGHFMMITIVLQLQLFTFSSSSARAVCVYSLFPALWLTTEPANHQNPGCKICLCSQNYTTAAEKTERARPHMRASSAPSTCLCCVSAPLPPRCACMSVTTSHSIPSAGRSHSAAAL